MVVDLNDFRYVFRTLIGDLRYFFGDIVSAYVACRVAVDMVRSGRVRFLNLSNFCRFVLRFVDARLELRIMDDRFQE